eukprot:XP_001691089.1 predicted protein [Chlamydomonas reinhardtii]
MKENRLLGRLLQDLQAKLECSESEVVSLDTELGKRESDLLRMGEQLTQCKQEAQDAHLQLGSCRAHATELEQQLVDVSGRLADKEASCEALQRRLAQAEGELRRLRDSSVSGQDVSQQLQRLSGAHPAPSPPPASLQVLWLMLSLLIVGLRSDALRDCEVVEMHRLERKQSRRGSRASSPCITPATRGSGAGLPHTASRLSGGGNGRSARPVLLPPPAAIASAFFPDDEGNGDPSNAFRRMFDRLRDVQPASDAGRPSRRGNPLCEYVALLSCYKASKMQELLDKMEMDLDQLQETGDQRLGFQADLGVRLRHPEAAGMALLGAELAVAEYNASPLPASHLACLGELVMHLATMELAWSVLEKSTAAAEAQSEAEGNPSSASVRQPLPSHVGVDKAIMNCAAKEVEAELPLLLVERWKLGTHARYGRVNQRPAKKDLANVAKALLAVLYLDGGYAEAVRPALAQLVAEVLLRPRSGSDSEDGSTAAVSGPPTQSATDVSTVAARPCSVCMSCKDDVGSYVACGSSRCNGAGPTKVLLEREVENPVESKLALGTNKNARGTASDRLRKQLARLCSAPVRTAQMVALLPQLERDTGDPAVAARVPECVYGVLGTVMLEGGLKHARAVARSLIEIAESVQSA